MDWTERRERLRSILAGGRCIYPGSVFDPISARIAEDVGFEAMMFAGSIASFSVLGAPDVVTLTLTEFAQQALRINRAGKLPLLVDADHGYGNALSVKRTVEELETVGVAGLTIEDTLLPTTYGSTKASLIPVAEGVGKMKAALAGRQDRRLVIVARTSAMAISGVEDTIARLKAYEAVGVDMLFMAGVKTRAQLDAVASAVKLPLFLGSVTPELHDLDYLSARNVRVCLQGHLPFLAAVNATYETLRALRNGIPPADIKTHRHARSDEEGHAPGRLREMVEGLPRRRPRRRLSKPPAAYYMHNLEAWILPKLAYRLQSGDLDGAPRAKEKSDAIRKRLEGADLRATKAGRLWLRPRAGLHVRGRRARSHSIRRLHRGNAWHRTGRQRRIHSRQWLGADNRLPDHRGGNDLAQSERRPRGAGSRPRL